MYCDFYQLSEKPFNVTPDPRFLYLNARYREALASLHYGISERKGFVTLIGEAGTGKTTLLNKLLDELDPRTKTVLIFNTNVTFEDILEYVFAEFDLPVHSGKKLYLLQRLNAFLLEELRDGGNVALLIDEAQDLEFSVLEDLRLLSNLETAKEKILQIILTGQPELGQKLSSPALRQLRQRIAVNCRLLPLSREEMSEYIQFRLQAAGCSDPRVFTRDAEDQIWQISRGIPRLVNVVCDNALVIGYAMGRQRISGDVVREAAADMIAAQEDAAPIEVHGEAARPAERPQEGGASRPRGSRTTGTWAIFAAVAIALVVGLISVGRSMLGDREPPTARREPAAPRRIIRPGAALDDAPPVGVGIDRSEERSRPAGGAPRPQERVGVREATDPPSRERAVAVPEGDFADDPAADGRDANGLEDDAPESDPPPAARPAVPAVEDTHAAVPPNVAPPADARPGQQAAQLPASGAATDRRGAAAPPLLDPPAAAPVGDVPQARPDAAREPDVPAGGGADVEGHNGGGPAGDRRSDTEVAASDTEVAVHEPVGDEVRLAAHRFDEAVVRDGDSIGQMAVQKYGQASYTVLDLLKLANPHVQDIDRIAVGQTIALPELNLGFSILENGDGQYGVLVQSAPTRDQALALARALRGRGFSANVSRARIGASKTVYRVLIGSFADENQALAVGQDVQRVLRDDERLARLGRY